MTVLSIGWVAVAAGLCVISVFTATTVDVGDATWWFGGSVAWLLVIGLQALWTTRYLQWRAQFLTVQICRSVKRTLLGVPHRPDVLALIGDVSTVVLDEPTSGMDQYSRRSTWNILQDARPGRTMMPREPSGI